MKDSKASIRYAFENGLLKVRTPSCDMLLRWHPTPSAVEKTCLEPDWASFTPEFRVLPASGDISAGGDALRAFRSTVPEQLVRVASRFHDHQWALMRLMHRHPAARELADANPVLAWALANAGEFNRTACRTRPEEQVSQPRKEILSSLGFPGTGSVVRLFARILPDQLQVPHLFKLRTALSRDPQLSSRLNRLAVVNTSLLTFLCDPDIEELCTRALITQLSTDSSHAENIRLAASLRDALDLRSTIPGYDQPPPSLASKKQVHVFIDRTLKDASSYSRELVERGKQMPSLVFQPPPFPGTGIIVPITNRADLMAEGRMQHNCVSSYERRIREGRLYVYRILEPQRATLSIIRTDKGRWLLSELETRYNRPVYRETRRFIDQWLKQEQVAYG